MSHALLRSPPSRSGSVLRWLALAGWIVIVLANIAIFVLDLSIDYSDMLIPCTGILGQGGSCNNLAISSAEMAVLASWGADVQFYAAMMLVAQVILFLGYAGLGSLILWQQGINWLGLIVSLALIVLPITVVADTQDWSISHPTISILVIGVSIVGSIVMLAFLYLLPNGRFSPRWAYIPLTCTIFLVSLAYFPIPDQLASLANMASFGLALFGVGLQIYRYRQVSSPIERQQTKWILFAIVSFVVSIIVWTLIFGGVVTIPSGAPRLLVNLGGWFLSISLLLILPVAITTAILRYKLWGIDVVVRRTLQYALLTGLLALLFFGSVILLQAIFGSVIGAQSPVAIVLSTLLIAALFTPLRLRVQDVIDRRFYRKKYDAHQVLAQFATTARDETDMNALTAELARVVQETMQPESVKVWMRKG